MSSVEVTTSHRSLLNWDYQAETARMSGLYRSADRRQWSLDEDVDWSVDVEFGSPLPDDSDFARRSFEASPLAHHGRPMWDVYRWEVQAWMISQFLHGEQAALVVAGRLVEAAPTVDAKLALGAQVFDEARHVDAFSRYTEAHIPEPYAVNDALLALLEDILQRSEWDLSALGMHLIVEGVAMAAFRLAGTTFHDDLIKQIMTLVARDESRHVALGVDLLRDAYTDLSTAERAHREELVLEAAQLMCRRFMLEDVWDRLGVDRAAGVEYARTDPLLIMYRRTIFRRVVKAMEQIDLLTPRVVDGFKTLGVYGPRRERGRPHALIATGSGR